MKFNFKNTPYYLEYNTSLIVAGFSTQDNFEDNECLEREKKFKTWKS